MRGVWFNIATLDFHCRRDIPVKAPSNSWLWLWLWLAMPLLWAGASQAADAPAAVPPQPAAAPSATPTAASAMTDEQKTLYALGVLMSRGLENFQLTEAEFNTVRAGLSDSFHKRL